jgi:23S rRNA pseudouridine2457 synthase
MKYIAFNKPFQVLSQFTQPENSDKRTLSEFGFPKDVYPVGRLDYDSEGLLLLSDDGRFIKELLDPSEHHPRRYLVQIENVPSKEQLRDLQRGVVIEGKRTRPAEAILLNEEPNLPPRPVPVRFRKNIPTSWIELTLTEGRNRQVRKMTAAVGCPTLRLIRWAIGRLNLDDLALQPGEWDYLSDEEVDLAMG